MSPNIKRKVERGEIRLGQNINADINLALRGEYGNDAVTPKVYESGGYDGDLYVFLELKLPDAIVGVYAFPVEEEMEAGRHIMITAETPNGHNSDAWEYTDYDPAMSEVIKSINDYLQKVKSC